MLPILIDDCEIPWELSTVQYLDLRGDLDGSLQALASRLGSATRIDLSTLSEHRFSELVADLLGGLGFSVERVHGPTERGFDLVARCKTTDPFGASKELTYLVEVKHYRHGRANLDTVHQLLSAMEHKPADTAGLLVTSSQFTSALREWASAQAEKGARLRLMDGAELKRLLFRNPAVTTKYFGEDR